MISSYMYLREPKDPGILNNISSLLLFKHGAPEGQQVYRIGGQGPEMTSTLRSSGALPEVRVDGQVVSHGVLPALVVGFVEGKTVSENNKEGKSGKNHTYFSNSR